jgi:hypothetical protein
MTSNSYPFDHAFPSRTATRIVREVKGIDRICYDVTRKPPPFNRPPGREPWRMNSRTSSRSKKKAPLPKRQFLQYASPPPAITKLQNIVRETESAKNAGAWKVAIQRRGTRKSKYFSDKKFGGKAKALAAAKDYRDSVLATV